MFKDVKSTLTSILTHLLKGKIIQSLKTIENLSKKLENSLEIIEKIQFKLNEYLENKRNHFARLYFLGDEDLLELLCYYEK